MAEVFEAKILRVGNSLGLIIPASILEELGYGAGDVIKVAIPPSDLRKRNRYLKEVAGIFKKAKPFKREKEDRY